MKNIFNLTEWLINAVPVKQQLTTHYHCEVDWSAIVQKPGEVEGLLRSGLKIQNLHLEYDEKLNESNFENLKQALQFCRKHQIECLVVTDMTGYKGNDKPLLIRQAQTYTESNWDQLAKSFQSIAKTAEPYGVNILIRNRCGTAIEKLLDFEKLANRGSLGFYMDIPNLLYINQNLKLLPKAVSEKVVGFRLGSMNPCAWVYTRQNDMSWNQVIQTNVFLPFRVEYKQMLNAYLDWILEIEPQLKFLSLSCEASPTNTQPEENFKVALLTLETVTNELKAELQDSA